MFDDTNEDAYGVDPTAVSTGPKLGPLAAFEAAYEESRVISAQFGAEVELRDAEQENIRLIRKAGGSAPASLNNFEDYGQYGADGMMTAYTKVLRSMAGEYDPESDDRANTVAQKQLSEVMGERAKQLAELKAKYPDAGIKTYDELWRGVMERGAEIRRRAALHTTTSGGLASMIGSMAGGMNPRTNPLSFFTAGIGGAGRNILTRALGQGAVQAGVEAIEQGSGKMENERFFGEDPTTIDALTSIGLAGLGGAAFQGGAELLGRGLRSSGRAVGRWFADKEAPPPPIAEPDFTAPPTRSVATEPAAPVRTGLDYAMDRIALGETRAGRAAGMTDLEYLSGRLASWTADPYGVNATDTAVGLAGERGVRPVKLPNAWDRAATARDLDGSARNVDPQTFRSYDRIADKIVETRADIGLFNDPEMRGRIDAKNDAAIEAKRRELERAKDPKEMDKLTEQLTKMEAARKQPTVAEATERLKELTKKAKALHPAVERAYARAQGLWDVYDHQREQIKQMVDEGRKTLPDVPAGSSKPSAAPSTVPRLTITDRVPELRQALPAEDAMGTVQRVVREQVKALDDEVERYQSAVAKLLSDANETGQLTIEGQPPLALETKMTVPNEDGEGSRSITIRQLLEETQEDLETFKAVGSCSVGPTS